MFNKRSDTKELLDGENIPKADLYQNLRELDTINNLLGGYNITFNALKKVLSKNEQLTLVDIGSGGGDTLKRIQSWNTKHGFNLKLYGIDLKQVCVDYSVENNNSDITFICDDYRNIKKHISQVDIIHACLFCHHLTEQEIIDLVKFCHHNKITLVINDLESNIFAYYGIKILTTLFSKSYLVKNDAPLSVLRGFKKADWKSIIIETGAKKYSIKNKWAFRHEIIVYAE
jgi:2-polyprenyl-3-methyl-5-hydroxy-6-metoxy-1,4-benzoquinol methylase